MPFAAAQYVTDSRITDDTFIDSSAAGAVNSSGVDEQSYGMDAKVKGVSADTPNSNSGASTSSFTHVLFKLPQSVISDFSAGQVTKVTVNYYPVNDSLSQPPNDDGDDRLELHPLAPSSYPGSFTIGDGTQTPAKLSDDGGATWQTRDGSVKWTNPGGDFDSTDVVDTNYLNGSPYPVSKGSTPFSWDITSLMNVNASLSDLETNGGLIKMPNDPNYSSFQITNMTQDFVSLDSAQATSLQPYIEETFAPEPGTLGVMMLAMPLIFRRRRKEFRSSP